jgi:hypothetical protein
LEEAAAAGTNASDKDTPKASETKTSAFRIRSIGCVIEKRTGIAGMP